MILEAFSPRSVKIVLTSLTGIAFAYWFYEPFDADIDQPWKMRLKLRMSDVYGYIATIYSYISGETMINASRRCMDYFITLSEDPDLEIRDDAIDGVRVRVYIPRQKANSQLPGVIFYHGGGWCLGSLKIYERSAKYFAKTLSAVVITVDYRMAPEVTFPVPLDDCVKVTEYVLKNSEQFGIDASRIAIAGDSAGGNLAAAVSLRLRDENVKPRVKLQVLIYPALQALNTLTPSYQQNAKGPILSRPLMGYFWSMYIAGNDSLTVAILKNKHLPFNTKNTPQLKYLDNTKLPKEFLKISFTEPEETSSFDVTVFGEFKESILSPYLSPLMADDLSNLPEAYVITCHLDVLRDEGYWYADRLREAGNKVTHKHYRNAFHGSMGNYQGFFKMKDGVELMGDMTEYLIKTL